MSDIKMGLAVIGAIIGILVLMFAVAFGVRAAAKAFSIPSGALAVVVILSILITAGLVLATHLRQQDEFKEKRTETEITP